MRDDLRTLAKELMDGLTVEEKMELLSNMRVELLQLEDEIEGAEDEDEF